MTSLINTITHSVLIGLLSTARREVVYVTPGLSTTIAEALVVLRGEGVRIRVVIDSAETSFRNGYGELAAVERLQKVGCEVLEVAGNRISFLLTDNTGYLLFNQSLALEEQGPGTNAVQIDAVQQQQLLLHFFPPRDLFEATQRIQVLQQAVEQTSANVSRLTAEVDGRIGQLVARPLNPNVFGEVAKNLINNPPVHPDRRRQTMVYTSKFQFVELEFKGANIGYKRVDIPKDVLPVRDKRLKDALETKLRILEDQKDLPKSWLTLKDEVEKVRETYLVNIASANKNVLNLNRKQAFTDAIKKMEDTVSGAKQELSSFLMAEVMRTKNRFAQTLMEFYADTPPDELISYVDDEGYPTYLKEYVADKIRRINFPKPAAEIEKVMFTVRYFDVTWEDLNSENFLKELQIKKLISERDFEQLRATEQMFKSRNA